MALSSARLRTVLNWPHPRQLFAGSPKFSLASSSLGPNVVTKRTYIRRQDKEQEDNFLFERQADAFLSAVQTRRSIYGLTSESTISDERITQLVERSISHTPTAFNSQSNVAVVLFREHHIKLWDIVSDALKAKLGEENYKKTEAKVKSFQAAYGTVLWFIENHRVNELKEKFPSYADLFDSWALQSVGMAQSNVWVSLEREGLGANLQHYGNLIEERTRKHFNVPEDWILISQQPFGTPSPDWKLPEKKFRPINERVKVFN